MKLKKALATVLVLTLLLSLAPAALAAGQQHCNNICFVCHSGSPYFIFSRYKADSPLSFRLMLCSILCIGIFFVL